MARPIYPDAEEAREQYINAKQAEAISQADYVEISGRLMSARAAMNVGLADRLLAQQAEAHKKVEADVERAEYKARVYHYVVARDSEEASRVK